MKQLGAQYQTEIRQQPQVLANLLSTAKPQVEDLAALIREAAPHYGVLVARGSSDNAGRYGQYLFGIHNGLTMGLALPSVFTLYQARPSLHHSLTIGISQSGQSTDIVEVLQAATRQGALTIAITNDPSSPLARAAHHVLTTEAGVERAVAATKTYTSQLMIQAMLSAAWADDAVRWNELERVSEYVQQVIDTCTAVSVDPLRELTRVVVLGRGYNYCSAFEVALKLKETCRIMAEPYSFADLFHGPVAMIEPGFPIALLAPRGAAHVDVPALIDVATRRQARLIVISDDEDLLSRAEIPLRLPTMPEWLSPIATAVAGQLLAASLAEARGLDPDAPAGLTKVTLTY